MYHSDELITRYPKAHTLYFKAELAHDKSFFVTGSDDYTVKLFLIDKDVKTARRAARLNVDQRMLTFCLTPDDKYIIGYHYHDNTFSVIEIQRCDAAYKLVHLKRFKPQNLPIINIETCTATTNGAIFQGQGISVTLQDIFTKPTMTVTFEENLIELCPKSK